MRCVGTSLKDAVDRASHRPNPLLGERARDGGHDLLRLRDLCGLERRLAMASRVRLQARVNQYPLRVQHEVSLTVLPRATSKRYAGSESPRSCSRPCKHSAKTQS